MGTTRIAAAVLVVAVATAMSACGSSSTPSAPAGGVPLAGTSWVLTTYLDLQGVQAPPAAGASTATLAFADTTLSGSTGCNSFVGTYTQDGSAVSITTGGLTAMACPGPVVEQESSVLAALGRVATATQDGTSLVLADEGGTTLLTYEPGVAGLAGTSWMATGINNGKGGVQSNADTNSVTAEFASDGTMSGNGGCNSYGTTWTATGTDAVEFGPVASTQLACDLLETEQRYFHALEKVTNYRIEGEILTLVDDTGSTQVTFAAS